MTAYIVWTLSTSLLNGSVDVSWVEIFAPVCLPTQLTIV